MIATFINAFTVILGGLLGLLLKKKISSSFKDIVMTAAGVTTLVLGLGMALEAPSAIANLFSMILGGFIGFALRIEDRVLSLGDKIERLGGSSA